MYLAPPILMFIFFLVFFAIKGEEDAQNARDRLNDSFDDDEE